jgi:hypothetical protein
VRVHRIASKVSWSSAALSSSLFPRFGWYDGGLDPNLQSTLCHSATTKASCVPVVVDAILGHDLQLRTRQSTSRTGINACSGAVYR